MTNLQDPKWPKLAARHKFIWHTMTDRDKVHFIAVVQYNKERQEILDSNQDVLRFTAQIAESSSVSDMVLGRLQDMKDEACKHLKPVGDRELEMVKVLGLPLDPPRLVQNPNTGDYDVMFCDMSHLHLTAKEAQSLDGRERIKSKFAELEKQR